ncbi:MAG: thiamine biosynthesis lipoprotein [Cyclobacteriaceae bacterium]
MVLDKRKLFFRGIVAVVVIGALYRYFTTQPDLKLFHIAGHTMGTIEYNVKYLSADDAVSKTEIDATLIAFNKSVSTYIPDSEISKLNLTGTVSNPSEMFIDVLRASSTVFQNTDGVFDPTVGPLVNAWGFGPNKRMEVPDSMKIVALKKRIGFQKLQISDEIVTMDSLMFLDFSAIAKGYAVDLIAEKLESNGIQNYLVEIGGEVRALGFNDQQKNWSIGIEDPLVGQDERKLLAIVRLEGKSMATSGNYRNYYKIGDRIIAHTIDPRTGYNTTHNLLSASVIAKDCMTADAYATAFMVVGLAKSKEIAKKTDLDVFLIYQKEDGTLGSYISTGLETYVEMNKTMQISQ